MNLYVDEIFIETCAQEYFNGCTKSGLPYYQVYTFDFFVEMKKQIKNAAS